MWLLITPNRCPALLRWASHELRVFRELRIDALAPPLDEVAGETRWVLFFSKPPPPPPPYAGSAIFRLKTLNHLPLRRQLSCNLCGDLTLLKHAIEVESVTLTHSCTQLARTCISPPLPSQEDTQLLGI